MHELLSLCCTLLCLTFGISFYLLRCPIQSWWFGRSCSLAPSLSWKNYLSLSEIVIPWLEPLMFLVLVGASDDLRGNLFGSNFVNYGTTLVRSEVARLWVFLTSLLDLIVPARVMRRFSSCAFATLSWSKRTFSAAISFFLPYAEYTMKISVKPIMTESAMRWWILRSSHLSYVSAGTHCPGFSLSYSTVYVQQRPVHS